MPSPLPFRTVRRLVTAEDLVQVVLSGLPVDAPASVEVQRVAALLRDPRTSVADALAHMQTAHQGPLASHPTARAALTWLAMVNRVECFDGKPLDSQLDPYLRGTDAWNTLSFVAEYQRARYCDNRPWQRGMVTALQDPRVLNRIPVRWRPEHNRGVNGEPDALVWQIHQRSPRIAADFALSMANATSDPTTRSIWARIGISATHRYASLYPRSWRARGVVSPRARVPIPSLRSQRRAFLDIQGELKQAKHPTASHLPTISTLRDYPSQTVTTLPNGAANEVFANTRADRQRPHIPFDR